MTKIKGSLKVYHNGKWEYIPMISIKQYDDTKIKLDIRALQEKNTEINSSIKNIQDNNIYPQVLYDNIITKTGLSSGVVFEVPYFPLVNGYVNTGNSQVVASDKNVCMHDAIVIPYKECTLYFTLPSNITAYVYYSDNSFGSGINTTYANKYKSSILSNGDSFKFPNTANLFRIQFSSDKAITTTEITELIDKNEIRVVYVMDVGDIVHRNSECTKLAFAAKQTSLGPLQIKQIPVFIHMSDPHGDAIRTRDFFEYADFIEANYSIMTGDFCSYSMDDGMGFVYDMASKHKTTPLICIGNHDCWGHSTSWAIQEFNKELNKFATKYSYNMSNTSTNYYYKDLTDIKIRIIALDDYENCEIYKSQTQINWFINTLKTTPAGYGVIIINHGLEVPCVTEPNNDKFFESVMYYDDSYIKDGKISKPAIRDIVDAFIGKTSITDTCSYKKGGGAVTYTADFSGMSSSTYFICYMSGHIHRDFIGTLQGAKHKQVQLNITPNCTTQPNARDVPMGYGKSSSQNVFNIYGIDKDHHNINIVRIGGTVTHDLKIRDFMVISYK